MLSGKCPKCGSTDLLLSTWPGGVFNHLAQATTDIRTGMGQFLTNNWRTCVCAGCGYTESYLDDQEAIAAMRVGQVGEGAWSPVSPAGWHPDPTGRHERRRWNGLRWTDEVQDGGVESRDSEPL